MFQSDIINIFGRAHSMSRYLEICTPTTGNRFAYVDPAVWMVRHRLMYRCPGTFDDGLPFHFRTQSEGGHDLIRDLDEVLSKSERYDLIFVDPWHSYDAGILDLNGALCLLRPGGVIVVHDCNPTDPTIVGSDFKDGDWCGLTYQSFIDFVLAAQPAGYLVVDTDYGCGLVFTQGSSLPPGLPNARPAQRLIFEWCLARAKERRDSLFSNGTAFNYLIWYRRSNSPPHSARCILRPKATTTRMPKKRSLWRLGPRTISRLDWPPCINLGCC